MKTFRNGRKVAIRGLLAAIMLATGANGLRAEQQSKPVAAQNADSSKTNGFSFEGGALFLFMDAVKQQCGLDLQKYGEIEHSSENLRVPKMRLQSREFAQVAELFNYVSEAGGGYLGKWVVRTSTPGEIPDVIVFIPPHDDSAQFTVRAFALKGIPQDREALVQSIRTEAERLLVKAEKGDGPSGLDVRGDIHLANEGQILVASGGKVYLQLVEELVSAFRQKPPFDEAQRHGN